MENVMVIKKTNLEFAREGFDNFAKGDITAIVENCSDDVVWATYAIPGVQPSGKYHGKEGVREYFRQLSENVEFIAFEPREYIVQEDNVVVLGHEKATAKKTGKTFDHEWCIVFKVKEGKTWNWFMYLDTRDLAEASH